MAMYDDKRTRNLLDYNQKRGENLYNNASQFVGAQGQQFQNDYGQARQSDEAMRNAAFGGYQDFAKTGGFTPGGIAAMRSRAMSPVRAAYSNAQRNLGRMGGNMPGRATMIGRMAREQGQAASDAATNTEAGLASLVQQGRLQGLGGMTNLYGTTPGASALFSRNVLENTNQGINLLQGENQRMQGLLGTQLGLTQAPGNMDKAMQWGGQVSDMVHNAMNPFDPTKTIGGVKKPAPINM